MASPSPVPDLDAAIVCADLAELFEYFREVRFANPRARVADRYANLIVGRARGRHLDLALLGEFDGVRQQVDEHLLELCSVGPKRRQVVFYLKAELRARPSLSGSTTPTARSIRSRASAGSE